MTDSKPRRIGETPEEWLARLQRETYRSRVNNRVIDRRRSR